MVDTVGRGRRCWYLGLQQETEMKNNFITCVSTYVAGVVLGYVLRYEIDAVLFFFFGAHTSSIPMC